jgi:hypothetical protein
MADWRAGPLALSTPSPQARAGDAGPDTQPAEDTTLPMTSDREAGRST